jgi:THAP domain
LTISCVAFRFPKNPQRRAVWLKNCDLSASDIKTQSKICSVHFSPICFKVQDGCNRVLNPDAEPTIFHGDTAMPANEVVKIEPTDDFKTDERSSHVPHTVSDGATPSTTVNMWRERPLNAKPTENDESNDSLERISIRITTEKSIVNLMSDNFSPSRFSYFSFSD